MVKVFVSSPNALIAAAIAKIAGAQFTPVDESTDYCRHRYRVEMMEGPKLTAPPPRQKQRWNGSGKRRARAYKS